MKKLAIVFPIVVISLLSRGAFASGCSTSTLKGTYLFEFIGSVNGKPLSEAGMDVYDGKGNVVSAYSDSNSGGGRQLGTAVYTLNPDCSGVINYGGGVFNTIYVSPDGNSLVYLTQNSPGTTKNIISGRENRVSRSLVNINR